LDAEDDPVAMRRRQPAVVRGARGRIHVAAVAGAVLLVAACGSGEAASTGSSGLGTVKVIETNEHELFAGGADVASHLALWNNSLDVEIAVGESVVEALATGDADIAIGAPNRFIGGIGQGLEATIVGPTIDVWSMFVVASTDHPATSLEGLRGARFGVTGFGTAGHYAVEKTAEQLGWGPDDYSVVTMGDVNGLTAGLQNGAIDAFMWSGSTAFALEKAGHGSVIGSVRDVVGPNPLVVIAVRDEVIEERPAAVRAFCDGFYTANTRLQSDPALAERIFVDEWGWDADVASRVFEQELMALSTDGEITEQMLSNMVDAARLTVEGADDMDAQTMREMYTACETL
jgi:ABC-type nitrate/sulfonate/bicarbonate transport system substrate-binding protein